MVQKVRLVQPQDAQGETAKIFDDIRKTKGGHFLTPAWGFFALDPELLRHWWGLTKRLQITEGAVPKPLLNSIALVCAAEIGCPRCINNHQTHLMERFGLSSDDVMDIIDFENSDKVDAKTKAVLRFSRKVAFNEGTTTADFEALRKHGITDLAVLEIVSIAMLESAMARHAVGVGEFESRDEWPRAHFPASNYVERTGT